MPSGDFHRHSVNVGVTNNFGGCYGHGAASLAVSKIVEDQMDLSKTHAMIAEIRDKALTALIINRIPDHRIVGLKRRWIVRFMRGGNREWFLAPECIDIEESDEHLRVHHQPPSGVHAVPVFSVMRDLDDDAEDPELFIANRITVLVSLSQISGHSVVDVLRFIEGSASPLEQLARQAE